MNDSHRPEDAGFTLVELLVVVIIIGILTAIGIPTFLAQRKSGWQAQLVTDTRSVVLDIEAVFAEAGGVYLPDQAAFNALGFRVSDPATTFGYTVNSRRSEFCVVGDHVQLDADRETAYASSAGGLQAGNTCPAFRIP